MEERPMKKKQYIAAIACLVAGVIGFGSVYATEKAQQRRQESQQLAQQQEQNEQQETPSSTQGEEEPAASASSVVQPKSGELPNNVVEMDVDRMIDEEEPPAEEDKEEETQPQQEEPQEQDAQPTAVVEEALHFDRTQELVWPLEGNVLLNYSMDATIYFPTLDQYRYNPATIISGNVNDKVYIVAKGKISDIYTDEETGCTVMQDLGDGYTAIYGQLKEVNFEVGDMVESGQVIGYVSEPTKYYSVEGSNLYFELQKDGVPVDPLEYFE